MVYIARQIPAINHVSNINKMAEVLRLLVWRASPSTARLCSCPRSDIVQINVRWSIHSKESYRENSYNLPVTKDYNNIAKHAFSVVSLKHIYSWETTCYVLHDIVVMYALKLRDVFKHE